MTFLVLQLNLLYVCVGLGYSAFIVKAYNVFWPNYINSINSPNSLQKGFEYVKTCTVKVGEDRKIVDRLPCGYSCKTICFNKCNVFRFRIKNEIA